MEARFEGELEVISEVDGKQIPILMRKFLSVEGLEFNLISVRKLDSESMKIVHEGGVGLILNGKKKLAVAPLDRKVNLYKLNFGTAYTLHIQTLHNSFFLHGHTLHSFFLHRHTLHNLLGGKF